MPDNRMIRVLNPTEVSQIISWLEDQREKDRIIIDAQQHLIDRLTSQIREQDAALGALREEVKRDREVMKRLPGYEDSARKSRVSLAVLEERIEALERNADRATQIVRVETERDRKAITEMQQRTEVVAREIDSVRNRLHFVEANRKAFDEHSSYVLQRLDELFKADEVAIGKVQTLDDARRRIESVLPVLQQQREQVTQEIARILAWQQLADVRWTTQISTWRNEMDERARDAEEDARVARQLSKQFIAQKDSLEELRRMIDDRQDQFDAISIELVRLQNQRVAVIDQIARVDQAIELVRRRVDEQIGVIRQIEDRQASDVVQIDDLESQIDSERQRIDDLHIRIVQIEDQHNYERTHELERMIREVDRKLADAVNVWQKKLGALNSRIQEQMVDLGSLEEQQKLRQLADLEQQIKELKDRHSRVQVQLSQGSALLVSAPNGDGDDAGAEIAVSAGSEDESGSAADDEIE